MRLALLAGAFLAAAFPASGATFQVYNSAELITALQQARPGDAIVVESAADAPSGEANPGCYKGKDNIGGKVVACVAAAVTLIVGSPAGAWVHGSAGGGGGSASLPSTQTINFGAKTLIGAGGSPMGYAAPQNLGVSAWLCKTSETVIGGGASQDFVIDDRNMLVPTDGAGSVITTGNYDTARSSPLTSAGYSIVVRESTTPCASPTYTSSQTTITATVQANAATVREMTAGAVGGWVTTYYGSGNGVPECGLASSLAGALQYPCETLNPDGGTGASFGSGKDQITAILKIAANATGALQLGDVIIARSGWFNPTSLAYGVTLAAGVSCSGTVEQWCPGAGTWASGARVGFESEVIDAALDANGNPRLEHGFEHGGFPNISESANRASPIPLPLDVDDTWAFAGYAAPAKSADPQTIYLDHQGNKGNYLFGDGGNDRPLLPAPNTWPNAGWADNRIEWGPGCGASGCNSIRAVFLSWGDFANSNHLIVASGVGNDVEIDAWARNQVDNNVSEGTAYDFVDYNESTDKNAGCNDISGNFIFGIQSLAGNAVHIDSVQRFGNQTYLQQPSESCADGTFSRNISVQTAGATSTIFGNLWPAAGADGDRGGALASAGGIVGAVLHNNIYSVTAYQGVTGYSEQLADWRFNTAVAAAGQGPFVDSAPNAVISAARILSGELYIDGTVTFHNGKTALSKGDAITALPGADNIPWGVTVGAKIDATHYQLAGSPADVASDEAMITGVTEFYNDLDEGGAHPGPTQAVGQISGGSLIISQVVTPGALGGLAIATAGANIVRPGSQFSYQYFQVHPSCVSCAGTVTASGSLAITIGASNTVTAVKVQAGGLGYSVGDIITVNFSGSQCLAGGCTQPTFKVTAVAAPYITNFSAVSDSAGVNGAQLTAPGTWITSRGTTNGLAGTYTVNISQSVPAGTEFTLTPVDGTQGLFDHNIANVFKLPSDTTTGGGGGQTWNGAPSVSPNEVLAFGYAPAADVPAYKAVFPNYPSASGVAGYPSARTVGGTGITSRAGAITAFAPAVGTLFTASIAIGSNCLATAQSLATGTTVNGPGFANGAVVQGAAGTGGCSSGAYPLGVWNPNPGHLDYDPASASATETSQPYGTGAENGDGSYNGALFPPDTHGVISWNDGTVFAPSATHTAAQ
ncbi:MAG TPA: hypothetical protein VGS12_02545 [Caulobacteraceae bacterium]|nr:hypothetical protein [Caulobacteraceae bacterium]